MLIEKLRSMADGKQVVTLFNELNHALLDLIARVSFFSFFFLKNFNRYGYMFEKKAAFGMEVDSINEPSNELNHYVYESVKGFYRITFDPFIYVRAFRLVV